MFHLALFFPFIAVLLITGGIFLTSGYRRGLWHALFSLAITIFLAMVTAPLAKWLALPLAQRLLPHLPLELEGEAVRAFILPLVEGAVADVLSLFLYAMLLTLFLILFKATLNTLKWKKISLCVKEKRELRWAGLAVRFVDALLVTVLLLLPLYGTLSMATPVASDLLEIADGQEDVQEILSEVEKSPLVGFFGSGAGSLAMDALATSRSDEVSLSQVVGKMRELSGYLRAYENADEDRRDNAALALVNFLLDNVVDEPWGYPLFCILQENALKSLESTEQNEALTGVFLRYFRNMTKADYDQYARELLEQAAAYLEWKQGKTSLGDLVWDILEGGIGADLFGKSG